MPPPIPRVEVLAVRVDGGGRAPRLVNGLVTFVQSEVIAVRPGPLLCGEPPAGQCVVLLTTGARIECVQDYATVVGLIWP